MIDTDKYEGHTPGPWCVDECDEHPDTHEDNPAGFHIYALRLREDEWAPPYPISDGLPLATNVYYYRGTHLAQEEALELRETTSPHANSLLMADAPLLLEEVKRLQVWKRRVIEIVHEGDAKANLPNLRHRLKEMIE